MTLAEIALMSTCCLGVWLVVQGVPTPAPPSLAERTAPYLLSGQAPFPTSAPPPTRLWFPRWLMSFAESLGLRLARLTGGESSVQRRMDVLGRGQSYEQFRLEQLIWGLASSGAAVVLILAKGASAGDVVSSGLFVLLAGVGGVLARDQALSRSVSRRTEQVRAELPTVIEMLAMAVGAGASLTTAFERVRTLGHGALSDEFARVLDDTRVGIPMAPALRQMAARSDLHEVSRFVDAVLVAVERGTPLADVLAAQAGDAREAGRRALIEAGGRKEIGMMIPVVFLVLPLSVLFVLFPGFYGLSFGS
ncbi:MAG: type II secretion system F family protein [Actinomycetes bacterium]